MRIAPAPGLSGLKVLVGAHDHLNQAVMEIEGQLPALALVVADHVAHKGTQLFPLEISLLIQTCIVHGDAALRRQIAQQHATLLIVQAPVIGIDLERSHGAASDPDRRERHASPSGYAVIPQSHRHGRLLLHSTASLLCHGRIVTGSGVCPRAGSADEIDWLAAHRRQIETAGAARKQPGAGHEDGLEHLVLHEGPADVPARLEQPGQVIQVAAQGLIEPALLRNPIVKRSQLQIALLQLQVSAIQAVTHLGQLAVLVRERDHIPVVLEDLRLDRGDLEPIPCEPCKMRLKHGIRIAAPDLERGNDPSFMLMPVHANKDLCAIPYRGHRGCGKLMLCQIPVRHRTQFK